MIKIVFTGPESTGKTTLSNVVGKHFSIKVVEEYARDFINQLDRPYVQEDLLMIAKGQMELEKIAVGKTASFVICDTDLLTIKIWSEYKYGDCDPWILEQLEKRKPDIYFLCGIDVPWTFDPQREHPAQRTELFEIYKTELEKMEVPFLILEGGVEERMGQVVRVLNQGGS